MRTREAEVATPPGRGDGAHPAPAPPAAGGDRPAARPRLNPRWRRRAAYLGAALLLGALLFLLLRPSALEVETARVSQGPLRVTIDEEGVTRLADRYRVAAPVAGRLLRITLAEGDPVAAGQPVARLVPAALDPRTAEAARARVAAARAALRQAETRVGAAAAAAAQAERELPRRRTLVEAGALSRESLEQLELAVTTRRQEAEAARAAAAGAAAELEAARAALLEAGPAGGAAVVEVRSPVAGRVLRVPEASERVVAPGEPLLEIGEVEGLELVVDVLTTDAVRLRPGLPLLVDDWGGPDLLRGRVRSVEPEAFTRVSALGVEEQRVNVVGELADAPSALGVGYRAQAHFVVWESPRVLRLPLGALFRQGDGWGVYLVQDGRARLRRVDVGERGEELAQVLGGVRAGEEVILYPADRIEEGARVRPAVR